MVEYFTKIRVNTNYLATTACLMPDDNIITDGIIDLDRDYDPLITITTTQTDAMTLEEFYSHTIAFKHRGEFINYIAHDKGGNNRGKGHGNSMTKAAPTTTVAVIMETVVAVEIMNTVTAVGNVVVTVLNIEAAIVFASTANFDVSLDTSPKSVFSASTLHFSPSNHRLWV